MGVAAVRVVVALQDVGTRSFVVDNTTQDGLVQVPAGLYISFSVSVCRVIAADAIALLVAAVSIKAAPVTASLVEAVAIAADVVKAGT